MGTSDQKTTTYPPSDHACARPAIGGMRENEATGYGTDMASDETRGRGIFLVVAGIAVVLVILFLVLQYAR
jgi:hypothetical protein